MWLAQVLITNGNLDLVDDGIEYVIRTDKKYLDGSVILYESESCDSLETISRMDEWCTKQHGFVCAFVISVMSLVF